MIIPVLGSFVCSVILFFLYLGKVKRDLIKLHPELNKPQFEGRKSPYSIGNAMSKDKTIGYCIMAHGEPVYMANSTSSYVVYATYGNAISEMNRMERQGGFKITPP